MMRSRAEATRTIPAVIMRGEARAHDWMTLHYRSSEPYAVQAWLQSEGPGPTAWLFARDLVSAGLAHAVGEGDVRIWPIADAGRDTVRLAMRSDEGDVLVELEAADVAEFLQLTRAVCREGNESAHLNLDVALRAWVA
jgi:hypothetical protein